jgi:trehalose-phosphatase
MPALEEVSTPQRSNETILQPFFQSVAVAGRSVLLLDFDGTLAPFRVDPSTVRPWTRVSSLLDQIQEQGRTHLAIVTGRPAVDVAVQIGMKRPPEIWGLHGAERLFPSGEIEHQTLSEEVQFHLNTARHAIHTAQFTTELGLRFEDKWNAVVLHWRGKSSKIIHAAQAQARQLLAPFDSMPGITVLHFDGGVEVRAGRNKGDAVHLLLNEFPLYTPSAYLGDDTTDEDAFQEISSRGLGILVRREWRPTSARIWLRPPVELRRFLNNWLDALRS